MIIRFECDGFKSLRDVVLPLRPFQAFVGPNNAGKSNFFDALRLLSLVPDHDLPEALQSVRGEPSRLFTQLPDGKDARTMRLAVELLVEPTYLDELEGKVTLSHTRLRYEIEITRDDRADAPTGNAISITSEQLVAIDLILVEQPTLIRGHGLPSVRTTRYRPAASFVTSTDQVDEPDRLPIRADLGELWTSGVLGGVP